MMVNPYTGASNLHACEWVEQTSLLEISLVRNTFRTHLNYFFNRLLMINHVSVKIENTLKLHMHK